MGMDKIQKDSVLEEISDRIRKGIPVSLSEGIAAIDYQEKLREYRSATRCSTLASKVLDFFCKIKNLARFPDK
jgi:hypothetical protein